MYVLNGWCILFFPSQFKWVNCWENLPSLTQSEISSHCLGSCIPVQRCSLHLEMKQSNYQLKQDCLI